MTIRTPNGSHIQWKKHFHKNPLYFRLYADFEADNEKDKNTEKDIILTQEDEDCRNINVFRFCEKNIESDKVRDHCHLTGRYRGPAHSICTVNVTQKQSNFIPFVFQNFSNYDCHVFFKKIVDKKNDKKV